MVPKVSTSETAVVYDPEGDTSALLASVVIQRLPVQGEPSPQNIVVIGRRALLTSGQPIPFDVEKFVVGGGRLLVMSQDPVWIKHTLQLRTADHVARRVFKIDTRFTDLSDDNLRDWNGRGTPGMALGKQGAVSSAPIEKPHRTS